MPPLIDRSDAAIQSAEDGELNGLRGKLKPSLYCARVHFSYPRILERVFSFLIILGVGQETGDIHRGKWMCSDLWNDKDDFMFYMYSFLSRWFRENGNL